MLMYLNRIFPWIGYFQELNSSYAGEPSRIFILWYNMDITLNKNLCFGKLGSNFEFV